MKIKSLTGLIFLFLSGLYAEAQSDESLFVLYEKGEYETVVEKSAATAPTSGRGLIILGDSHQKLGNFDEAFRAYSSAEEQGQVQEAHLHVAICHYTMGEFGTSELQLIKHLEKYPDDSIALYYLAAIRFMTYEYKDALSITDDLLAIDANNMEAYYLRASCNVELNKNQKAQNDYYKALEIKPNFLRTKLNIAILDLEMGNLNEALEVLEKLVFEEIDFYSEAFYYLAETRFALHDQEGACESWQESADWGDHDAEASYKAICLNEGKKPKRRKGSAAF